jgi:hypothetical protein
MKRLLFILTAICMFCVLSFASNNKPFKVVEKKSCCDLCTYITCGVWYIVIMPDGWMRGTRCENYVALGHSTCGNHGGATCGGAEN